MRISKKGITPVIAMILLILIVVSLGGVFAAWTTRTWQSVQEKGTGQIEKTTESLQKGVIIDNIDCTNGKVYVRNTGPAKTPVSEISVYINDSLIAGHWNNTSGGALSEINPEELGVFNTTYTNITGPVRISVGAGVQDSSDKCVP